jgi:hypothetical protein
MESRIRLIDRRVGEPSTESGGQTRHGGPSALLVAGTEPVAEGPLGLLFAVGVGNSVNEPAGSAGPAFNC